MKNLYEAHEVHESRYALAEELAPYTIVRLPDGVPAAVGYLEVASDGRRRICRMDRAIEVAPASVVEVVVTPAELAQLYVIAPAMRSFCMDALAPLRSLALLFAPPSAQVAKEEVAR